MMKEHFHPGPHLDADQLNAFAEGALNERERQESLAHLAECAECRSIVFLAQEPLPPAPAFEAVPFWRRVGPLSLAGAALACGVVVVVAVQRQHRSIPAKPAEIATETPQPTMPLQTPRTVEDKAVGKTARAPVRPTSAAVGKAAKGTESFAAVGRSFMAVPPPLPPLISAGVAAGQVSSANESVSMGAASSAGVAAASGAAPQALDYAAAPAAAAKDRDVAINAGTVYPLPINGRDVAGLDLKKDAAKAPSGSLGLTIRHNVDTAGGLSEVAGLVHDATGAIVPGATVTLHQLNGAASRQVVTGADGRFTVAALPKGRYSLQIASPGFEQVSRVIDLQARDVATLNSTLQVGSSSQSVTVSAEGRELSGIEVDATDTAVQDKLLQGDGHVLPSKLPEILTAAKGKHLLAVDSAGTLFTSSKGGRHWKAVKAKWQGKIVQLTLVSEGALSGGIGAASPANANSAFQLKTDTGAIWLSDDGAHWHALR